MSLTNMHWLVPEFMGEEPRLPLPSAPNIVSRLIRSPDWECASGTEDLLTTPLLLNAGDGPFFRERLTDPDRLCPIILITRAPRTEHCLVDPGRLARLLAGAAVVYEMTSAEVSEELDNCLPGRYRCGPGTVRVYHPLLDFSSPIDSRRHRYFSRALIDELGREAVEDIIIRAITRRARTHVPTATTSIADIDRRRREQRMAELRRDGNTYAEYIGLLEEEIKDLTTAGASREEELIRLRSELEQAEIRVRELKEEHAADSTGSLRSRQAVRDREADHNERKRLIMLLDRFSTLPATLIDVVTAIGDLRPANILFLEAARQSAMASRIHQRKNGINVAWECLWHMATMLHQLYFKKNGEDGPGNIESAFKDATGFQLTLREGTLTRKNKDLMELRKVEHEGRVLNIEPHVKWDAGKHFLRVHYYACRRRQLIIVGHCGNHLRTAGTRRRKER